MFKRITSSASFPYIVRGTEAIAIVAIVYASSRNTNFTFIDAAVISGLFFAIIELIYAQQKIESVRAQVKESERKTTEANEVLRTIESCKLPLAEVKQLFLSYSEIAEHKHEMFKEIAESYILDLKNQLHNLEEGCYEHHRGDKCCFGRLGIRMVKNSLD